MNYAERAFWEHLDSRSCGEASKAERRYQAVDPDNRLVARGLEARWEQRLRELSDAEAKMERRQRQQPRNLNDAERQSLLALGGDLQRVWAAPTTTDRDRKELLRTLLEDVTIAVERAEYRARLASAGAVATSPA
jgi:hypothetical protein